MCAKLCALLLKKSTCLNRGSSPFGFYPQPVETTRLHDSKYTEFPKETGLVLCTKFSEFLPPSNYSSGVLACMIFLFIFFFNGETVFESRLEMHRSGWSCEEWVAWIYGILGVISVINKCGHRLDLCRSLLVCKAKLGTSLQTERPDDSSSRKIFWVQNIPKEVSYPLEGILVIGHELLSR